VMGDAAVAVLGEEQHLAVPGVGAQRPAVRERDDRALAPVLVIELGAVFGGDRAHDLLLAPFSADSAPPLVRLSTRGFVVDRIVGFSWAARSSEEARSFRSPETCIADKTTQTQKRFPVILPGSRWPEALQLSGK